MRIKIGTSNERAVYWDDQAAAITIYGTSVTITGAVDKEKAIELCERNLKNFKAAKQRYYDLTVYFNLNDCGYSILEKRFQSFERMIRYCKDFDVDCYDFTFDVWDSELGQYNINDYVEA